MAALGVAPDARAAPTVERLGGSTRYETAAAVAGFLHPGGATTAVVASGTDYPDALAAGVAAAALDAPLLLASATSVPTAALTTLGVTDVILVGGTAALSEAIASDIASGTGADVRRIAGANRYDTASAVAELTAPSATGWLRAPGDSFATALVAAAHAARTGARLLLAPGMMPDELVVDGDVLRGAPGDLDLALLARFPPATTSQAVVTTIESFPDALSAAALSGALGAPVLFTGRYSATPAALDAFRLFGPDSLVVVGGDAAVPDAILQQLFGWAPLPPVVAPGAEAAIALDVFARVNGERTARGVAPLVWDASLAADAARWAAEMGSTGYRHAPVRAGIGENIHARGGWCEGTCHPPTSGLLHGEWMGAADNRDNIVDPGYVIGGVGVHCAPDGTLYAVELFGIGFEGLSTGGSPATPFVHDDRGGVDCAGSRS